MIPDSAWGALPQHPGPNRLLLLLWQFSGWKPGGDPPFAWPSVDTLACRLRLRARTVREGLEKLRELGYIRPAVECRIANGRRDEREGWRLFEDPADAAAFDIEAAAQSQLDLFAGSAAHVDNSVDGEAAATDGAAQVRTESAQVRTSDGAGAPKIGAGAPNHPYSGAGVELASELVVSVGPPPDDDDASRIWSTYEADRARMLPSSSPPRTGPPPLALRALIAEIGLPRVEAYARRSLELAADAVARDRLCAATLVLARHDGREWHVARVEAVERYHETARSVELVPRPPPPPDPLVDGARVDLHEREAYERGGDDAVRAQRRELIERPTAGVAHIEDWLQKHRAGGSHV